MDDLAPLSLCLHSRQLLTAPQQTSLRHSLISPPEDAFFSASISLKLRDLANTSTSTMAMRHERKEIAASDNMPWVASMFASSVEGAVAADRRQDPSTSYKGVIHNL